MASALGSLIREARKHKRLTQEQLAATLDVSQTLVSDWERGAATPDDEQSKELRKVLHVPGEKWDRARQLDKQDQTAPGPTPARPAAALDTTDLITLLERQVGPRLDGIHAFLLATAGLPLKKSKASREEIAKVIERGGTYHILWFADLAPPDELRAAVVRLQEIARPMAETGEGHRKRKGDVVYHYCERSLHGGDRTSSAEVFEQKYKELQESKWPGQVLIDPGDIFTEANQHWRRVLQSYVNCLVPIGVYGFAPTTQAPTPTLVRVSLHNLFRTPDGDEPVAAFAFPGAAEASELFEAVWNLFGQR
jgi:transcriptional regulator with XRE-family HTH domain